MPGLRSRRGAHPFARGPRASSASKASRAIFHPATWWARNNSRRSGPSRRENASSITAVVAAGACGGTDNLTRTVQPMPEERLDTSVTVINLPATSGALTHQRTARSDPNGEALDFASSTFITSRPRWRTAGT